MEMTLYPEPLPINPADLRLGKGPLWYFKRRWSLLSRPQSTRRRICHNCRLIYAGAWTQLFPLSTVVKERGDARGLGWRRPVFIRGACPSARGLEMDVLLFCWGLLSSVNLRPCGRYHLPIPLIPSSLIPAFLHFSSRSLISFRTEPAPLSSPPWPSVSSLLSAPLRSRTRVCIFCSIGRWADAEYCWVVCVCFLLFWFSFCIAKIIDLLSWKWQRTRPFVLCWTSSVALLD